MVHDDNDFLEKLPEDVEEIEKDPILKPLLDFREGTEFLKRNMGAETEYLTKAENKLKILLETGIFEESPIARPYKDVLDIYQRLFLILKQYAEKADKTIYRMNVMKNKYYITRAAHQKLLYANRYQEQEVQITKIPKKDVKKEMEEFGRITEKERSGIETVTKQDEIEEDEDDVEEEVSEDDYSLDKQARETFDDAEKLPEEKKPIKNPWIQYRAKIQAENPHMAASEISRLAAETYKPKKSPLKLKCKYCGSVRLSKQGFTKNKRHIYECYKCKRTFVQ